MWCSFTPINHFQSFYISIVCGVILHPLIIHITAIIQLYVVYFYTNKSIISINHLFHFFYISMCLRCNVTPIYSIFSFYISICIRCSYAPINLSYYFYFQFMCGVIIHTLFIFIKFYISIV